ncbi:MAG: DUF4388 domain-containing protein, partial [Pyrinomonadaceae bacterium]
MESSNCSLTLTGRLSDYPLSDLLEIFRHRRETGCLEVTYGQTPGLFRFKDGELVEARFGPLAGREAVSLVLRLPDATFNFSPPTGADTRAHWRAPAAYGALLKERIRSALTGRGGVAAEKLSSTSPPPGRKILVAGATAALILITALVGTAVAGWLRNKEAAELSISPEAQAASPSATSPPAEAGPASFAPVIPLDSNPFAVPPSDNPLSGIASLPVPVTTGFTFHPGSVEGMQTPNPAAPGAEKWRQFVPTSPAQGVGAVTEPTLVMTAEGGGNDRSSAPAATAAPKSTAAPQPQSQPTAPA